MPRGTDHAAARSAEKRSSNLASDAVVNANTVFIDDVAARVGRHGQIRVRAGAPHERCVRIDRCGQNSTLCWIVKHPAKKSFDQAPVGIGRAHTPARTNARPNSAGRIAVAMFPSGRDEWWVSAVPRLGGSSHSLFRARRPCRKPLSRRAQISSRRRLSLQEPSGDKQPS
jgi:hypothetical protein